MLFKQTLEIDCCGSQVAAFLRFLSALQLRLFA
jgi:hypothetical protein